MILDAVRGYQQAFDEIGGPYLAASDVEQVEGT
jgi:hypothetical protein